MNPDILLEDASRRTRDLVEMYEMYMNDKEEFIRYCDGLAAYDPYVEASMLQHALIYLKQECLDTIAKLAAIELFLTRGDKELNDLASDKETLNALLFNIDNSLLQRDNSPQAIKKENNGTKSTKKRPGEASLLNGYQTAKMFAALAKVKAISGKGNYSEVANWVNVLTGYNHRNARIAANDESGLSDEEKKQICTLLQKAIEEIEKL